MCAIGQEFAIHHSYASTNWGGGFRTPAHSSVPHMTSIYSYDMRLRLPTERNEWNGDTLCGWFRGERGFDCDCECSVCLRAVSVACDLRVVCVRQWNDGTRKKKHSTPDRNVICGDFEELYVHDHDEHPPARTHTHTRIGIGIPLLVFVGLSNPNAGVMFICEVCRWQNGKKCTYMGIAFKTRLNYFRCNLMGNRIENRD